MKNMIFILVMFISLFLSIYYVRQILTDDSTNLKTKKKEIMGAIFSVTGVIVGLIGLSGTIIINNNENNNDFSNEHNYKESQISETQQTTQHIISSINSYIEQLQYNTSEEVIFYDYNDYDNDGICEMFALTGKEYKDYIGDWSHDICGKLWFVNRNGVKQVDADEKIYHDEPKKIRAGEQIFLVLEKPYTTGSTTYIWGVKDNEPYQSSLTKKGMDLKPNEYGEFEFIDSTYDLSELEGTYFLCGHTWKKYYFYFNGIDFKEYGGIQIEYEDLLKIEGINEIIDIINNDGYTINSIYYRENNMININLSSGEMGNRTFYNITLRINNHKIKIILSEFDNIYHEGIYKAALIPELATYPSNFPY